MEGERSRKELVTVVHTAERKCNPNENFEFLLLAKDDSFIFLGSDFLKFFFFDTIVYRYNCLQATMMKEGGWEAKLDQKEQDY